MSANVDDPAARLENARLLLYATPRRRLLQEHPRALRVPRRARVRVAIKMEQQERLLVGFEAALWGRSERGGITRRVADAELVDRKPRSSRAAR